MWPGSLGTGSFDTSPLVLFIPVGNGHVLTSWALHANASLAQCMMMLEVTVCSAM